MVVLEIAGAVVDDGAAADDDSASTVLLSMLSSTEDEEDIVDDRIVVELKDDISVVAVDDRDTLDVVNGTDSFRAAVEVVFGAAVEDDQPTVTVEEMLVKALVVGCTAVELSELEGIVLDEVEMRVIVSIVVVCSFCGG